MASSDAGEGPRRPDADAQGSDAAAGAGGAGGATATPQPREVRRLLLLETALVLGVSLGASAWYSLLSILDLLTQPQALDRHTTTLNNSVAADRPWLDLLHQLSNIVLPLVPAALAAYLLASRWTPPAGVGGAFGMRPRRPGFDMGLGTLLALGIGVPGLAVYVASRALGINTTVAPANLASHWWTVPVLCLAAVMNAVLEEVVMVGYLFTRWRQAGWSRVTVVVASALIRGSYHLYQGFGGFIGNVAMGLVFGWLFLRTRRLLPLVVAHALLDVASFVGYQLLHGHVGWGWLG